MTDLQLAAELAQWALLLLVTAMAAGLIYLIADIRRRLGPDLGPLVPNDGLAVGATAPLIEGTDARSGAPRTWQHAPGRPAVVAFLSPTCPPCEALAPHLDRLARSRRDVPVCVTWRDGLATITQTHQVQYVCPSREKR